VLAWVELLAAPTASMGRIYGMLLPDESEEAWAELQVAASPQAGGFGVVPKAGGAVDGRCSGRQ